MKLSKTLTLLLICPAILLFAACATNDAADDVPEESVIVQAAASEPVIPFAEGAPEEVISEPAAAPAPERLSVTPKFDKKLLVAFYPGIENAYKAVITKCLENEYQLTVVTAEIDHAEPDFEMRDNLDNYLQDIVNSTYRTGDASIIRQMLPAWGLTEADLKTKEGRQRFGLNMYLMSGQDIESTISFFHSIKPQYSALTIIDEIRWGYELDEEYAGILTVTAQDLYSGSPSNDYIFSKTSGNICVMSTVRFTDDDSSNTVHAERITKLALSSAAGILKLPKCTTAECVRAEATTNEAQDAKSIHLCNDCREKLNEKFAAW